MKKCIGCGEVRPDGQFSLRRKGGTARRNECKFCHAKRERERKAGKRPAKVQPEPTGKMKVCRQCGEEKDLIFFDRDAAGKFGRHARCKPCRAKKNAEYILDQGQDQEERGQPEWNSAQNTPKMEAKELR